MSLGPSPPCSKQILWGSRGTWGGKPVWFTGEGGMMIRLSLRSRFAMLPLCCASTATIMTCDHSQASSPCSGRTLAAGKIALCQYPHDAHACLEKTIRLLWHGISFFCVLRPCMKGKQGSWDHQGKHESKTGLLFPRALLLVLHKVEVNHTFSIDPPAHQGCSITIFN